MARILPDNLKKFIKVHNWLDKQYRVKSDGRYHSFKAAFNLFFQRGGTVMLETGCARIPGDWGGGLSTALMAEVLSEYGGHLWSIDNNQEHLNVCKEIIEPWKDKVTLVCSDSVQFLKTFSNRNDFPGKIDLLYLDSFDYPYDPIIQRFGSGPNPYQSIPEVEAIPEELILEHFENHVRACQQHTVNELYAALPMLHDKSIVLIDDNQLAGGGKSRLAREELMKLGWECIIDYQQTLWIKKNYQEDTDE